MVGAAWMVIVVLIVVNSSAYERVERCRYRLDVLIGVRLSVYLVGLLLKPWINQIPKLIYDSQRYIYHEYWMMMIFCSLGEFFVYLYGVFRECNDVLSGFDMIFYRVIVGVSSLLSIMIGVLLMIVLGVNFSNHLESMKNKRNNRMKFRELVDNLGEPMNINEIRLFLINGYSYDMKNIYLYTIEYYLSFKQPAYQKNRSTTKEIFCVLCDQKIEENSRILICPRDGKFNHLYCAEKDYIEDMNKNGIHKAITVLNRLDQISRQAINKYPSIPIRDAIQRFYYEDHCYSSSNSQNSSFNSMDL